VITRQLQVERRTRKVRRPKTDILPLYHATSHGDWLTVKTEVVFQSNYNNYINIIVLEWQLISCVQEQYQYLYQMAVEYMDSFETYANFK